jgi:phosphoribosylamine--glycine ligase
MASGGYPTSYENGFEITGLDENGQTKDAIVYHAGTKIKDGKFTNNGGRVLGVTCTGLTLQSALDKSYNAVKKINWKDVHYRKYIGQRALKALDTHDPLDLEYKQDMEDYIEENGVYLRQ